MPQMYAVNGTLIHHTNDKCCVSCAVTKQIPTFYLNADVQGIVDEKHAEQIAREIVCPIADDLQYEAVTVNLTVVKV